MSITYINHHHHHQEAGRTRPICGPSNRIGTDAGGSAAVDRRSPGTSGVLERLQTVSAYTRLCGGSLVRERFDAVKSWRDA
eukprot:6180655-Pleurochrysis_carterae.AAC.1